MEAATAAAPLHEGIGGRKIGIPVALLPALREATREFLSYLGDQLVEATRHEDYCAALAGDPGRLLVWQGKQARNLLEAVEGGIVDPTTLAVVDADDPDAGGGTVEITAPANTLAYVYRAAARQAANGVHEAADDGDFDAMSKTMCDLGYFRDILSFHHEGGLGDVEPYAWDRTTGGESR